MLDVLYFLCQPLQSINLNKTEITNEKGQRKHFKDFHIRLIYPTLNSAEGYSFAITLV